MPLPIAIPTSAVARAGASLIPSPTIATTRPSSRRLRTTRAFSSGETRADTRSIPTSPATLCAAASSSPVSIITSTPPPRSRPTAPRASARSTSDTPNTPAAAPSITTTTGVAPSPTARPRYASTRSRPTPASAAKDGDPTSTRRPATEAEAPRPGCATKCCACGHRTPHSDAYRTMARAAGCSDASSTLAAASSSSLSGIPGAPPAKATDGLPSVSVPVLSRTTVSTRRARCRASPSRISTPCAAAFPIAIITEIGVASPSAHGQAITRTATAVTTAKLIRGSGPARAHTKNVTTETRITAGTKYPATTSTVLWIGGFVPCVRWTS